MIRTAYTFSPCLMATRQDGLSDVFEQIQYTSLIQWTLSIAGGLWEVVGVFIYVMGMGMRICCNTQYGPFENSFDIKYSCVPTDVTHQKSSHYCFRRNRENLWCNL